MKISDHSSAENRGLPRTARLRNSKISRGDPAVMKKAAPSTGTSGKLMVLRQELISETLKSLSSLKSPIHRVLSLLQQYRPSPESRDFHITLQILEELVKREHPEGQEHMDKPLGKLLTFLRQERDLAGSSRESPVVLAESLQNPPPGLPWSLRAERKAGRDESPSGEGGKEQELVLQVDHPLLGPVKALLSSGKSGSSCTFYSPRSKSRRLLRQSFRNFALKLKEKGLGTVRLKVQARDAELSSRVQDHPGVNVWG